MDIDVLKTKISEFEKCTGFDKTNANKLVDMLKEELKLLESGLNDKSIVDHQLVDLLVLIIQISNRYNTDFDLELEKWFEKSERYLR